MKNLFCRLRRKIRRSVKGAISLLLSIVLLTTFSLGSLVMESGRYQSAKAQLNEANLSAAISMLSNYDETLSKSYGLFAFPEDKITNESYYDYLRFNSDLDEEYYGGNISRLYDMPTAEIDSLYNLTNPAILKRQILEYSKYNVPLKTASELLDVDELIKQLKKNIKKAIPGLEKLLDVCDTINQLTEALEQIYQLEKTIANIEICYSNDNSLMNKIMKGLENIESYFKGEATKDYSPSYISAYDTFKTAVQNKVTYMKNNPAPQNPGNSAPYSQSTVNSRETAMNNAKKQLTDKIINILVAECENTEVFGKDDSIELTGDGKTCVSTMEKLIKNLNKKTNEKDKIQTIIKSIAKENYNYTINKWNEKTLDTLKSKMADEPTESVTSLKSTYDSAKSNYNAANSANKEFNEKKKAYDEYQKKLKDYNEAISTAAETYKTRCSDLKELLGKYKTNLDKALGNLTKAEDAFTKLDEGKTHQSSETFSTLKRTIMGVLNQNTDKAIGWFNTDILNVNTLLGDSSIVDSKFSVTGTFKKHDISPYYLSGFQAAAFVGTLNSLEVIDKSLGNAKVLFQNLGNLAKLFSGIPYITDLDCNVTLSSETIALLPTTTGAVSSDAETSGDIAEINTILSDAKTVLSSQYNADISMVSPGARAEEADLVDEISTRLDSTIEAFTELTKQVGLLNPSTLLFVLAFQLKDLVDNVITIVDNFKFFIQNFEKTFNVITSTLYENVLINSYILEKFPNRVDRSSKAYKGYDGVFGLIPQGETTAFKAAAVEYVLTGKYNEIENQNSVFWKIFILRMINNIVCVATDKDVMQIISSCNIFALLVFPLWVYFETNLDMNVLLTGDGGKVPFIKTSLILSPKGLEKLGESLGRIIEDIENADINGTSKDKEKLYEGLNNRLGLITDELLEGHGVIPFSYDNYLWLMMFLTSNKTKVMRVADLIQMDTRYQQVYGGKGGTAKFMMSDMNTFIRVKASAKFNSVLPIISMSKSSINDYSIKATSTKYVGY